MRSKQVNLIDRNQHSACPVFFRRDQQPGEERGGFLDARVGFEVGEGRDAAAGR